MNGDWLAIGPLIPARVLSLFIGYQTRHLQVVSETAFISLRQDFRVLCGKIRIRDKEKYFVFFLSLFVSKFYFSLSWVFFSLSQVSIHSYLSFTFAFLFLSFLHMYTTKVFHGKSLSPEKWNPLIPKSSRSCPHAVWFLRGRREGGSRRWVSWAKGHRRLLQLMGVGDVLPWCLVARLRSASRPSTRW